MAHSAATNAAQDKIENADFTGTRMNAAYAMNRSTLLTMQKPATTRPT
jgi:hypothetical protein